MLHPIPKGIGYRKVAIIEACGSGGTALLIENIIGKGSFEFIYTFLMIVVCLF
jgi:hypothetical protein